MTIPEVKTLGSRIKEAREAAKLSQAQLAKFFDISRNAVSMWESDDNAPTADKLGVIADKTGVSITWLMNGRGQMLEQSPPPPPAQEFINIREMPRDVPVRGIALGGEDGAFEINAGDPIDWARRPPRLWGIRDAYALIVAGTSVYPWREAGDLVYAAPRLPVLVTNHVVVQIMPKVAGDPQVAYIKRLTRRTERDLRLEQYNPPKEIIVPMARVAAIHRVLEWSELLGI